LEKFGEHEEKISKKTAIEEFFLRHCRYFFVFSPLFRASSPPTAPIPSQDGRRRLLSLPKRRFCGACLAQAIALNFQLFGNLAQHELFTGAV
jgi:hypothetical protein